MSNLHLLLDEANKHDPKGFIPATINTFPWKDELGLSTYREQMELPKAINFVDGTLAAPTTADGDIYVLIGAGVIDGSWGGLATFGDWVRFTNSIANPVTPVDGSLCYNVATTSWMEYTAGVWATFGGGGVDTNLQTNDLTLTDPSRFYNVNGNDLQFKDGANNRLRINPNGVAIGNTATPVAGTALNLVGENSLGASKALSVENASGLIALEVFNDRTVVAGGNFGIGITPTAKLHVSGDTRIDGNATVNGNIAQSDTVINNTITGTSAGSLSDSAYYNDTGVRAQFLMGGSTYGVGGNLELINNTFGIRTTDDFPIGSRNGVIKFSLGGDFTNANTRVKFTPTGAIFGAAVGLISAGAELDVRGAAKIATDLTLTTGDITQTNNVVVNTITGTSAGSLSEFAYYNDTGIKGQFLMGGSTYGVGGNLELINNSFGIRGTNDFAIGSRNGDIKFSLGSNFTNANTRVKFTSTGAIFGASVGLVAAGAKLHVVGTIRSDQTTVLSKTISTDFLPINVNGTVRYLALYD